MYGGAQSRWNSQGNLAFVGGAAPPARQRQSEPRIATLIRGRRGGANIGPACENGRPEVAAPRLTPPEPATGLNLIFRATQIWHMDAVPPSYP